MKIDINNLDWEELEELPKKEKVIPKKKNKKDPENPLEKDTCKNKPKRKEPDVLF